MNFELKIFFNILHNAWSLKRQKSIYVRYHAVPTKWKDVYRSFGQPDVYLSFSLNIRTIV